ncbi:hypothetical protein M0812_15052 [Anaeramoeba flamelloides]|uniref:t-SNARE coiled-coil homology domain-containing protein n=1 Tax=Anaeramoeba flamelloides TaxID=1746091 RepID=A0AAV7ZF55_9EUKA|nr:hypothetical protein M0812_15052 [Anaeramoeba flamelloides]
MIIIGKALLSKGKNQKEGKYHKLKQAIDLDNERFISEVYEEQKIIMEQQEAAFAVIHQTVRRIKEISHLLGEEISDHDKLSDGMNTTQSKLKQTMGKSKKLLNNKDGGKLCMIGVLILVLIVFLIIIFK